MEFWDNPTVDGFHSLLMTPKPMIRTSDHVFQYGSDYQLIQQKLITSGSSCIKNLLLAVITRVRFPFRAEIFSHYVWPQLLCLVLFNSHSGYVSWWSFSPAVRNWISSVSSWTTVEIMSMLHFLLFCHCFSEDWAKGFASSPTPCLLTLRWERLRFWGYSYPYLVYSGYW